MQVARFHALAVWLNGRIAGRYLVAIVVFRHAPDFTGYPCHKALRGLSVAGFPAYRSSPIKRGGMLHRRWFRIGQYSLQTTDGPGVAAR